MENTSHDNSNSETHLFQYLVVMFQNLAMQQMGKLINPVTGKLEQDLQQARITIDMVQMIKEKTAGNLKLEEQRLIDKIMLELQMNYVDEAKRIEEEPEEKASEKEDEGGDDEGAKAVSDDAGSESNEEPGDDEQAGEETRSAKSSASKPKDVKKASRRKKAKRKKKNG